MRVGREWVPTYGTLASWCRYKGVKAEELADMAHITQEQAKNILALPLREPAYADDHVPWVGVAELWARICSEIPVDQRRFCAQCDAPLLADRAIKKFCSRYCQVGWPLRIPLDCVVAPQDRRSQCVNGGVATQAPTPLGSARKRARRRS